MSTEIVFFDAGGTILDPHPSFAELFARVCQEHGRAVTPAQVRDVQDRIAPHLVELVDEAGLEHGPTLSPDASRTFWTFTYTRFLRELDVDDAELAAKLYERFSATSSYKLYEDVSPTFDSLGREGYRLGLISNFDGWLEKMLVEMEVGHVFDVAVISGIEGIEKPDPEIYERAVERAGVLAAHAVHVGDSPVMDMEPATAAGLKVVLLDRAGRYPNAPYPRIETLEDLTPLVSKL